MHKSDLQTAWFGVFRPEDSRPSFQLYGRLLELTSKPTDNQGLNQDSEQRNRTPGLVSFVGDTGAGKSSLIRLLIENQNRDSHPFQNPVVGSSTSIQPTSEDVHLYADPWTASSDAPLLYADCEGLLGGDRAPLVAALKHRLYRPMANTPITSSPIASSPQSVDDDVNRRLIVYERERSHGILNTHRVNLPSRIFTHGCSTSSPMWSYSWSKIRGKLPPVTRSQIGRIRALMDNYA